LLGGHLQAVMPGQESGRVPLFQLGAVALIYQRAKSPNLRSNLVELWPIDREIHIIASGLHAS